MGSQKVTALVPQTYGYNEKEVLSCPGKTRDPWEKFRTN